MSFKLIKISFLLLLNTFVFLLVKPIVLSAYYIHDADWEKFLDREMVLILVLLGWVLFNCFLAIRILRKGYLIQI